MGFGLKTMSSQAHIIPLCTKTSLPLFPRRLPQNQSLSWTPTKHKLLCVKATKSSHDDVDLETTRPLAHFSPSSLGAQFLSLSVDKSEFDAVEREIESEMKPKVRDMLMSSLSCEMDRIRLIHLLISLGISHYFESEIEEILNQAFEKLEDLISKEEDDLETIAIMFEVFRLYRHKMSCDVFDRFRSDHDGKLKDDIVKDVRGMLQLYQASHLRTPSEDVMEETLSFTRNHLESLVEEKANNTPAHLLKHIRKALHIPRYQNIEILVAIDYISFYEQEEEGHNATLLKFAKLNLKYCKLHYIQELKNLTKWWKELDLASKLPYFRDRIVELYVAMLGVYFEPRYSIGRVITTKLVMIMIVVDDTYDAYATLPEVISFTDSLQKWDLGDIENLPNYMRIVFQNLWQTFSNIEKEMGLQGRSSLVQQSIDEIKSLSIAYLEIAKWARAGHVPSFDEYMEVGMSSAAMDDMVLYSYIGMEDCDAKITSEWFDSKPKIFEALSVQFRLKNDIVTFEAEMKRGEVVNGVNCYMKQHGVTKDEAVQELMKICRDHYKIMLDEFFNESSTLPRQIPLRVINILRLIDFFYEKSDEFGHPDQNFNALVTSLFS